MRSTTNLTGLMLIGATFLAFRPAVADEPPRTSASPPARVAPSGAAFLEKAWPDHPEWLAMLADIFVVGDRMSGGDGWFRKGVARTRFDWQATRSALDKDGDGVVSRSEFSGTDPDFARLDRNRDGSLSSPDFDFSPPPISPGSLLFGRADRDGDGKVTRQEFEVLFRQMDGDGLGFLSQSDLQQAFDNPAQAFRGSPGGPGGPTRATFLKSFVRGELGAFSPGPDLNQIAPDFTLRTVEGQEEITLSKKIGSRPVVLIFGNFTCGPFRGQAGNLEKLDRRYRDRATFLMVYVREAHPTDGWRMEGNDRVGVTLRQPRDDEERRTAAQACSRALGFSFPMLVDGVDDAVNDRYSGIPSRIYLIDRTGKVAYKSGRGPFGFKPSEMEHSLILLLQAEARLSEAARVQNPPPDEPAAGPDRSEVQAASPPRPR